MAFIKESDKASVEERLGSMTSDVTLTFFTQDFECDFCQDTRTLLEELAAIESRIKLQVFDFKANQARAEKYGIDKIPATVVENLNDYGIRFYGIPAGYEFSSLLDAIVMVSKGESGLSDESRKALKEIKVPVHLQVFVTPT